MAKDTSDLRIRRILHLHRILRSGEGFNKPGLMEKLLPVFPDLTERSLLSDLAFLRKLGADIPNGHKHRLFRYRRPFSFLSAGGNLDFNEVEEVLSYLRQLHQQMPLSGFLQLDRMYLALQNRADLLESSGQETLDFQEVLYEGEKWIGPILRLMREKCLLKFQYQPFEGQESEKEVFPLRLKEYNGRWFLLGIDPEKERLGNYALDRIKQNPLKSGRTFVPRILPDLDHLYRDVLGVSLEGGPAQKIVAIIRKPRALYVKTKPWHPSQRVMEESETSIRFSWHLYLNRELKTRVMEYLPDIRVAEPAELRSWVLDSIRQVMEQSAIDQ